MELATQGGEFLFIHNLWQISVSSIQSAMMLAEEPIGIPCTV
jgi:hypothetical protein